MLQTQATVLATLAFVGCASRSGTSSPRTMYERYEPPASLVAGIAIERPYQPWVFRSVLDGRARMVTIALHEELWVAYDATDGRLAKAWAGGVEFDGAVYTSRHGPQPRTIGAAYFAEDSLAMFTPWAMLNSVGRPVPTRVRSLGYVRYGNDRVTMRYELIGPDGDTAIVAETPEFEAAKPGFGGPVLRRVLTHESGTDRVIRTVPTAFLSDSGASMVSTHEPVIERPGLVGYRVIPGEETVIHMGFGATRSIRGQGADS